MQKHPLIGRAFHTQNEHYITDWQGTVIADCGGGHFLVQLFGWFDGGPSTQHIFHIAEFAARHDNGTPKFRFFDSMDHANSYMDNVASRRDSRAAHERREAAISTDEEYREAVGLTQ